MFTKKLTAVWKMLLTVKWASEGTQQLPSQAPGLCAMVSGTKWLHGGRDETLPGLLSQADPLLPLLTAPYAANADNPGPIIRTFAIGTDSYLVVRELYWTLSITEGTSI